jgi:hypothetical protein
MKSHVNCFYSSRLYVAIDNPARRAVVGLDGSWRLDMAHFFEELVHWYCFTRVMYNAPSSASVAKDITALMSWAMLKIAQLL